MENTEIGSYAFSHHARWETITYVNDLLAKTWIEQLALNLKYPECFIDGNMINKYFMLCEDVGGRKTYLYLHDNSYYALVEKRP